MNHLVTNSGKSLFWVVTLILSGFFTGVNAQPSSNGVTVSENAIPDWVLNDWEKRAGGSGTWMAENSSKSDRAPFDAYALHWEYGPGKTSLKGRLYAIKDGKDVRTLWEFLEYWHPAERKKLTVQYGNNPQLGFLALGEAEKPETEGESISRSRVFKSNGEIYWVGHRSKTSDGVTTSRSFNIIDGEWQERGTFVWKLQR